MSRLLHAAGALDEACLIDAARRCDRRRMAAQLSIASGVPLALVDRAVCHRSPKALISIVWQAGFSMRVASLAQVLLGQIQPVAMVSATTGGAYPFSEEEMRWQLELLNKPAS